MTCTHHYTGGVPTVIKSMATEAQLCSTLHGATLYVCELSD